MHAAVFGALEAAGVHTYGAKTANIETSAAVAAATTTVTTSVSRDSPAEALPVSASHIHLQLGYVLRPGGLQLSSRHCPHHSQHISACAGPSITHAAVAYCPHSV